MPTRPPTCARGCSAPANGSRGKRRAGGVRLPARRGAAPRRPDPRPLRRRHRRAGNALRRAYIERARGLPIGVFFNTTVHAGNFADVPMLTAFFTAACRCGALRLVPAAGRHRPRRARRTVMVQFEIDAVTTLGMMFAMAVSLDALVRVKRLHRLGQRNSCRPASSRRNLSRRERHQCEELNWGCSHPLTSG